MKSRWISHKGKRVFISDFSGMGNDAAIVQAECLAIIETLSKEQPNSVLAVTNVEGTLVNKDTLNALKQLVTFSNQYVKFRAVTGVFGFRRHFVAMFAQLTGRSQFTIFETLPQALDWIVEQ